MNALPNLLPSIEALRAARPHSLVAISIASVLAGCASTPVPTVRREGRLDGPVAGTSSVTPTVRTVNGAVVATPLPAAEDEAPRARIRRGTGQVINRSVASAPLPNIGGGNGSATFNFEGESLHAVVKAILGDMLGQNYVIAPGVQGTVTLATPKPVSSADAVSLLEMVLGWNNARMIYSGGRYNIVPSDQAIAGNVAPRTGPASTARGFEARTVPLKFVSASEMEKILKPYARPNAIINVDNGRNIITVGGSRTELENYLRTIATFDVDWLSGMSVGVFPLQSGRATRVVADLEKVFGENSKSPVAGMFRFLPLEGANAVMVITSQAAYLDDIQQWLDRVDGAGGEARLFSHELKYIKAKELAARLSEVFGGGGRGGDGGGGDNGASLMPGLNSVELRDTDSGASASIGGVPGTADSGGMTGGPAGGGQTSTLSLNPRRDGNGSVTLDVDGQRVGVSAVDETNSLLVRATPQAWRSIRDVIERLDVMPMQVQIEAQVVEVQLSGALQYGVNWFFEQAVSDPATAGGAGLANAVGRRLFGDVRGSIRPADVVNPGLAWTFLGRNAAAVINALDQVTDLQLLQTPSVFVRNNAEATLNVGSRIPISSVTVDPGTGNGGTTYSQVQYLDTGIILKVRPRITRDGMVFLDIVQEISSPGTVADRNGNVRIDTRKVKTETAVQSGDTVMLAGLISDGVTRGSSGLPGLARIPVVGGLFGRQTSRTDRNEVIVLLTPTVVRNPLEVRQLTDDYTQRFRAMQPLRRKLPKTGSDSDAH